MRKNKRHIFDFDNTIMLTDVLNNEAYNYALETVGLKPITDRKRITREIVFHEHSEIDEQQRAKIINLKQMYFIENLSKCIPNASMMRLLKEQNPERCLLWTSAEKVRVLSTLNYYSIQDSFKAFLYSNKTDLRHDIRKICEIMKCDISDLVFYEDSHKTINYLNEVGAKVISVNE